MLGHDRILRRILPGTKQTVSDQSDHFISSQCKYFPTVERPIPIVEGPKPTVEGLK